MTSSFRWLLTVLLVGQMPLLRAQAIADSSSAAPKAPANWFNLDPATDRVPGVGTEKAYGLLQGKPAKTIIVGVIDGGVDIAHEDLKDVLWTNPKEIPDNHVDDDKNGYVDDVHGWNFIGGRDGRNVDQDTYEITREYKRLKARFGEVTDATKVPKANQPDYRAYQRIKAEYDRKVSELEGQFKQFSSFSEMYQKATELLRQATGKEKFTPAEVTALEPKDEPTTGAKQLYLFAAQNNINEEYIKEAEEYFDKGLKYGYNLDFEPRNIVGDNYANLKERTYGNNDVTGPDASHGTHVAGIIAANRQNNLGITGVADHVRIMVVRAVPDGDERDKDVANAIYYAVNNGAQVINMSFGKEYSPNKAAVDAAINYAVGKGVLLVHAAGNDHKDVDTARNFPTVKYPTTAAAVKGWLEIGASSWKDSTEAAAPFSNYGKKTVDVFAPGVDIYSTIPGQGTYKNNSGTSMASPVAAGVAALLWSYYPTLTAVQVKDILVRSSVKHPGWQVVMPGSGEEGGPKSTVAFGELCKSGGFVNAYEAVKLAEATVGKTKIKPSPRR